MSYPQAVFDSVCHLYDHGLDLADIRDRYEGRLSADEIEDIIARYLDEEDEFAEDLNDYSDYMFELDELHG